MKTIRMLQLIQVMMAIAIFTGCTKAREAKFAYGTGENLLSIADYDGKEFDLVTKDQISELSTSQSDKMKSNDSSSIRLFNVVKYETKAELMEETPFVGRKNTKYTIRYELTDKYLKVFKVSKEENISVSEMTYAEKIKGTNLFKIPLIGYPIKGYYNVTRDRNELNEQTSTLKEKEELTKKTASHFKIDRQGKEIFKAVQKIDVFPANFFDGDWYYSETITATNYASQNGYSAMVSQDKFGNSAEKVRLEKTENGLLFYNLNLDEKLLTSVSNRAENRVVVLSIPVSWKDYKQSEKGHDTGMTEEENTDAVWSSRKYAKVELAKSQSYFLDSGDANIQDLQISENYLAFTTINKSSNMKIRHSLLKAGARNYKPKTYFSEDNVLFGFFASKKHTLNTSDRYFDKDYENVFAVNRYNPANKEIVFHLADTSADWTRPVAQEAVNMWNAVFQKIGITVRLDEKTAPLGDIRYNILNMISQPDGNFSWGGFGPSLNDPQTGERIASTANVNMNDSINFFVEIMRRMVDSKMGLLDKAYIMGAPLPSFEIIEVPQDSGATQLQYNPNSLPALTKALNKTGDVNFQLKIPRLNKLAPRGYSFQNTTTKNVSARFNAMPESSITLSYGNVMELVMTQCPAVNKYISQLTPQSQRASTKDEYDVFQACAKVAGRQHMVSTLLHEMGHNFGLRHNFYGSVDVMNFIDKKVGRTSSIMEYTTSNEDVAGLGPYDEAAIMWAYADLIQETDAQGTKILAVRKINPDKSIPENMSELNITRKKYMYCTDEHVDVIAADPMCARSDAGTTPMEIIANKIASYNTNVALTSQRRDRKLTTSQQEIAASRLENMLLPIKYFYDYWRSQVAAFAGQGYEYLESYNTQQYQDLLKRMAADPRYADVYAKYYPASRLAYNFLKELAFMPDKYCVTQRELTDFEKEPDVDVEFKLFPLSIIKRDLFEKNGVNVKSCKDEPVIAYLKNKKVNLVAEGGYYIDNQYNDLSVNKMLDMRNLTESYQLQTKPDVIGFGSERAIAFTLLAARFPTNFFTKTQGFFPNFFDEPDLRAEMEQKVISRFTNGVDLGTLRFLPQETNGKVFSTTYINEKQLLTYTFDMFKQAMIVPGRPKTNNERMSRFNMNFVYSPDQISGLREAGLEVATTEVLGNTYYATEKSDIAFRLLEALGTLNVLKNSELPANEIVEGIRTTLEARLPTPSTIDKITFKDYMDILATMNKVRLQIYKRSDSEVGEAFYKRVMKDLVEFNQLVVTYVTNKKLNEDDQEKYMAKPFIEALADVNSMIAEANLKITEPSEKLTPIKKESFLVSSVAQRIQKTEELSKNLHEIYKKDKEENEAKGDLLTTAVSGM